MITTSKKPTCESQQADRNSTVQHRIQVIQAGWDRRERVRRRAIANQRIQQLSILLGLHAKADVA